MESEENKILCLTIDQCVWVCIEYLRTNNSTEISHRYCTRWRNALPLLPF